MDHGNFLHWQHFSVSDHSDDGPPPTSSTDCQRSSLEPSHPPTYPQIVSSIEEREIDDLADDPSIANANCYTSRISVESTPIRYDGRSNTYSSEPDAHLFRDRDTAPDIQIPDAPEERPIAVEIPRSTLTQPKSLFEGFVPPATEIREANAVAELLKIAATRQSPQAYAEFDVHDFSIYVNTAIYPYELRPLQHLGAWRYTEYLYFDGVVSSGEKQFYLREIPFRQLPLGNYGTKEHTVGDQIWIRSIFNEEHGNEIYYKLRAPSVEYARFHEAFLWIADLTKHFLDYCENLKEKGRRAVLHDFKSQFSTWLLQRHPTSPTFQQWHSANRSGDFRGAIIANIDFIWREANGLDQEIISWHTIWDEVKNLNRYKPNLAVGQESLKDGKVVIYDPLRCQRNTEVKPTVVTSYVYDLFSHMIFKDILKRVKPSTAIEKKRRTFLENHQPAEISIWPTMKRDNRDRKRFIASIRVGDVISTRPDDELRDTKWETQKSKHYEGEHLWFGVVQGVHTSRNGKFSFDVIWMYQPIDTPCGVMKYPWKNELFLSNNCTCHHDSSRVEADEILATHNVEWFGSPSTSAEFFVRQTYLADDCRWTTLKKEHLTCKEKRDDRRGSFKVGDAVLVETKPKTLELETFIIDSFFHEGKKRYARLRKLLRRRDVDKEAAESPPNEVVYTDRFVEVSAKRIFRHCMVRAFQFGEKIPTPYDNNGTGDLFFVTHQEVETKEGMSTYIPLSTHLLNKMRQGFDPSKTQESSKLQGLDLFCGGGNFGRGLEDGGAVKMRWANDIWSEAIHTYMANSEPDTCTPFLGSVDDLLLRALRGDDTKVPKPGDVHFISAGSPCPGFSILTINRTTGHQRKNQSLIASFASFVDLYRPHYGILENVPTMVSSKANREACVFSQLVCAIVGLGYQVQIMFLDAWSFGTPQSRSRVFLVFSAPGFRMPKVPAATHSHPPGMRMTKLGEMSCGRPFDSRLIVSTPFRFVSARDATEDLPDIQDAKVDYCVGYPDHRLAIGYTPPMRKQIFHIPTQPWEMNFSRAWFGRPGMTEPVLSAAERQLYSADHSQRVQKPSRGWMRVHPNRLFGTIPTRCTPTDSRVGCINHWTQHRPMTIMEVRRAQGFRDHEVLVAKPDSQWRIVGNSVARQVSLALGLAVREAWFGTLFDEPHVPQTGLARFSGASVTIPESVGSSPDPLCGPISTLVDVLEIGDSESEDPLSDTPSENPFLVPTPPKAASETPATSESNEFSDGDGSRKRSATSSLYVGVLAKRRRLGANHRDNGVAPS
ncbi:S-adenosyl-L-methionine-dependent methyltransferase [Hypomontagnella monticulosa]|nr:S-adenosyl-L-methionine-dependent methyltransferase [Hypomontagnella monticulosa]